MTHEENNESTFTVKFKIDDEDLQSDLQSVRQAIQNTIGGGFTNVGGGGEGGVGGGGAVGLGYGGGGGGGGGPNINFQGEFVVRPEGRNILENWGQNQGDVYTQNIFVEPTRIDWQLPPNADTMTVDQFMDWVRRFRTTTQGSWGRMMGEGGAAELRETVDAIMTIFEGQMSEENIRGGVLLTDYQLAGGSMGAMAVGARLLVDAILDSTRTSGRQLTTVITDLRKAFMATSRIAQGSYGISGQQMTLAHAGFQRALASMAEMSSPEKTAIQEFKTPGGAGKIDIYLETLLRGETGFSTAMTGIEVKMDVPAGGSTTNLSLGTARQVRGYAESMLKRYIEQNQGFPQSNMLFKYVTFGMGDWSGEAESYFQEGWSVYVKGLATTLGFQETDIPTSLLLWKDVFPTINVADIVTPALAEQLSRIEIIDPGRAKAMYAQIVMRGMLSDENTDTLVKILPAAILLEKEAEYFSMAGLEGGGFTPGFREQLQGLIGNQGTTALNPYASFGYANVWGESGQFMNIGEGNAETNMLTAVLNRLRHYSAQARAAGSPYDIGKMFGEGRYQDALGLSREMNLPPEMFAFFNTIGQDKLQIAGGIVTRELDQQFGISGANTNDLQNVLIGMMGQYYGPNVQRGEATRLYNEYADSSKYSLFRQRSISVNQSFDDLYKSYAYDEENFCADDRISFSGPNCPICGGRVGESDWIVKVPINQRRPRELIRESYIRGEADTPRVDTQGFTGSADRLRERRGESRWSTWAGDQYPYWLKVGDMGNMRYSPSRMVGGFAFQREGGTAREQMINFLYPFFRTGAIKEAEGGVLMNMMQSFVGSTGESDMASARTLLDTITGENAGNIPFSLLGSDSGDQVGAMGMWLYDDVQSIQSRWLANLNPNMRTKMDSVQKRIRDSAKLFDSSIIDATLKEIQRTRGTEQGVETQASFLSSLGSIGKLMSVAMSFQNDISEQPTNWEIPISGSGSIWRALGKTKGEVVDYLNLLFETAVEKSFFNTEGINNIFDIFGSMTWMNNNNLNLTMATDVTVWNLSVN